MDGVSVSLEVGMSCEMFETCTALELHRENDSKCLEHGLL